MPKILFSANICNPCMLQSSDPLSSLHFNKDFYSKRRRKNKGKKGLLYLRLKFTDIYDYRVNHSITFMSQASKEILYFKAIWQGQVKKSCT